MAEALDFSQQKTHGMGSEASYVEHIKDWIDSVSDLGVKAVIVLGPDCTGTAKDRKVFAVCPPQLGIEAEILASSNSFGSDWRSSNSPLSGFNNLLSPKNDWEERFLDAGFLSIVRLEFPLALNRAFECFMLCNQEIKHRADAAVIVYAMLGAWPLLKISISKGLCELSERERGSLVAAAEGLTALQAATRMGCTERTINFHWANAVRKLGADNKIAAIQRANWLGLI